jgi:hypothetical protein
VTAPFDAPLHASAAAVLPPLAPTSNGERPDGQPVVSQPTEPTALPWAGPADAVAPPYHNVEPYGSNELPGY